ncbi:hypothetical protein H9Q73_008739 [Fusarium xylarioides]|nr:hypothetical protein H9Q73_008739 [Fusarium xylarioides]
MSTLATLRVKFNVAESPAQILVDQMLKSDAIGLGDLDTAKTDCKASILVQQTTSSIVSYGSAQAKPSTIDRHLLPRLHYPAKAIPRIQRPPPSPRHLSVY